MAKKKVESRSSRPAAPQPAAKISPMDPDLLERLTKLMATNDLSSLDVREGDKRVSLRRGAIYTSAPAPQHYAPAPQAAAPASAPATPATPATPSEPTENLIPIKSPMVGTFYASPSPDAKAYVQVGSTVNEESDVCIIEAMKVFNNIKAEVRGTIAKIVAENGKPVEFGQTLFLVKP
jgi:acetyl-CoA carboxylase biotin carboxyl carrier protein